MSKATHTCSRQYEPASCVLLSSHTLSSVQSSQTLHHVVLSVELLSDGPTSVVERISPALVPSDGEGRVEGGREVGPPKNICYSGTL